MVEKWADFCITEVKHNKERSHIVQVKRRADDGATLGTEDVASRSTVVADITAGTSYVTALKNTEGNYTKGEDVVVVTVDRVKYIKTIANNTPVDNLGELPEF